jgi:hypothetical protein
MKAAANRDAGRRGLPMDPPQTSSDDSDESSDGEEGALLGTKGAAGTKGKAKARVWRRKGHLRLLEPFGACGEWLLSSNNRSAACLVAGAASAVGFTLSGHPHLAVKVGLGLAVVSLYLGLPQSEEDQAEEDELLQELHEDYPCATVPGTRERPSTNGDELLSVGEGALHHLFHRRRRRRSTWSATGS